MERAMRTWGSTVYRLALNQTQSPHDAEDICQDVFLRLLKDATAFKDDEHLKAWLLCVAINRCATCTVRPGNDAPNSPTRFPMRAAKILAATMRHAPCRTASSDER